MSYAICRVQKIKGASGVTGLQIHNERQRQHSNTNPDINHSRSGDNYSLLWHINRKEFDDGINYSQTKFNIKSENYNTLADERIKQGYKGSKAIRKDAVKICEILFTSDNSFFSSLTPIMQQGYFEKCLGWASKRFGKENIIAATVHMDEATPHMHVDFVPLTADGRLSAKEVLGGRFDLQRMQDDFFNEIGKHWGLERGERSDLEDPTAEKPKTHKSTAEYKRSKAIEELNELNNKIAVKATELKNMEQQAKARVDDLKAQENAIRGNIEALQATDILKLKNKFNKINEVLCFDRELNKLFAETEAKKDENHIADSKKQGGKILVSNGIFANDISNIRYKAREYGIPITFYKNRNTDNVVIMHFRDCDRTIINTIRTDILNEKINLDKICKVNLTPCELENWSDFEQELVKLGISFDVKLDKDNKKICYIDKSNIEPFKIAHQEFNKKRDEFKEKEEQNYSRGLSR